MCTKNFIIDLISCFDCMTIKDLSQLNLSEIDTNLYLVNVYVKRVSQGLPPNEIS